MASATARQRLMASATARQSIAIIWRFGLGPSASVRPCSFVRAKNEGWKNDFHATTKGKDSFNKISKTMVATSGWKANKHNMLLSLIEIKGDVSAVSFQHTSAVSCLPEKET